MAISPGQSSQPAIWGVSIGDYLIRRLQDYGVRDVFGIPGDYVLAFYAMLENSPIRPDRLHAGGLRRLCRRRLRPPQRHRGGVRDVLRGRAEPRAIRLPGRTPRNRRWW